MDQNFFQKLVTDRTFRTEFMASPSKFLASGGFADFEGKSIIVHENNATTMHFSLLPKGSDASAIENMDPKFVRIQEKAWADDDFKAELLNNTRTTVMEFFGSIPENLTIMIHENTKDTVHLVLPALAAETDELNDDDLEMIAGGKGESRELVENVTHTVRDVVHTVQNGVKCVAHTTSHVAQGMVNVGQKFFSGW
jgi:hypothetical protein